MDQLTDNIKELEAEVIETIKLDCLDKARKHFSGHIIGTWTLASSSTGHQRSGDAAAWLIWMSTGRTNILVQAAQRDSRRPGAASAPVKRWLVVIGILIGILINILVGILNLAVAFHLVQQTKPDVYTARESRRHSSCCKHPVTRAINNLRRKARGALVTAAALPCCPAYVAVQMATFGR
ncbi:hypothetical protein E4U41_001234 [Claviceps citrina]|nr:hypothetical protein E4U41_001234 [Claviceps citrina]